MIARIPKKASTKEIGSTEPSSEGVNARLLISVMTMNAEKVTAMPEITVIVVIFYSFVPPIPPSVKAQITINRSAASVEASIGETNQERTVIPNLFQFTAAAVMPAIPAPTSPPITV